jgi:hypothetical protein
MTINPWEVRGKSLIEKLGGLHWFWVGGIILVMIIIPTLRPLGLPISTEQWTVDAYNAIITAPKDKVIIWEDEWAITGAAEAESAHTALMRIMFANKIPFVMYAQSADTPNLQVYITNIVKKYPEAQGKVYGVDWVQLGLLPGGEGAIPLLAENTHAAFKTDYFGTPLDQLPLMNKLNSYKDVSLVISGSSSQTWIETPVRQWYIKYNVPIVSYTLTGGTVLSSTYYPNKGVIGIIEGGRGGAELEFLGKVFGVGQAQSDAKTLAFLTVAAWIIVGNISYFGSRREK